MICFSLHFWVMGFPWCVLFIVLSIADHVMFEFMSGKEVIHE